MKTKIFQYQLSRDILKRIQAGTIDICTNVSARGGQCLYPYVCGPYGCELSGNSGGNGNAGGTGGWGTGGGIGGGGNTGGPDPEQTV
ncbi:hypothetical protein [Chryseobacterium sp. JK1]|uniref:hypothetical protein n=1 Tax=Chryseobacterium sp. JK1 TaxID=874294 RepID=UPI003D6857CC